MHRIGLVAFVFILAAGPTARAIDVPDYDFEWCVIGDPGNVPFSEKHDNDRLQTVTNGSVPYVYRMAATEVTTAQWVEFFNALAQVDPETAWRERPILWGATLRPGTNASDPRWDVSGEPDAAMWPAEVMWRTAARLCNWLHNGKVIEPWAFVDGAYDASTFGRDQDDMITDDTSRRPGALFFLPSTDEWKKAVNYDPDRHGPGKPGWWPWPYVRGTRPVAGLPGEPGAETAYGAGIFSGFDGVRIPLLSYPDARTPWGLYDASGGMEEWTDDGRPSFFSGWAVDSLGTSNVQNGNIHDSPFGQSGGALQDRIDSGPSGGPPDRIWDGEGVRLASAVLCTADFDVPFGLLDLNDIAGFLNAYLSGDSGADLAEPFGTLDLSDVIAFVQAFGAGCW